MKKQNKTIEELTLYDFLTNYDLYGEPVEIKLDATNFEVLMNKLNEVIRKINEFYDQKPKETNQKNL